MNGSRMTAAPKIRLEGVLIVPPERVAEVAEALPRHIALTRAEPGCLSFEVTSDPEDSGLFHVRELFRDRAAFDAHQDRAARSDWAAVTKGLRRDYTISEITS